MDVFEYAKLRNLYSEVYASPEEVESEVQEVEEVEEENLTEIISTFQRGAGQIKRAGQKMFGNAQQRNDAVSYEKSVNDINKRNRAAGNNKQPTANDIAAETKGRRKADPNYKPGQGVGSGSKPSATKPPATKPPATKPPATKPPATKPPATKPTDKPTTKPAPPKRDNMASASKADRMAVWAKANPKLAAKVKQKPTTKPAPPKAPAVSTKPAPTAKPSPAAKPMSRIDKATTGVKPFKPMKEDFDIILEHLIESGFGPDEALKIMIEMSAEKRQEILEAKETEDSLRDRRQERGGVDGNNRYDRPTRVPSLADSKGKKKYDGMSAMEKVKAKLKAQYGDKAIKD